MKKFFIYLLIAMVLPILVLLLLVVSVRPAITDNSAAQVDNADLINPLLEQTKTILNNRFDAHELVIYEEQAESLAGFLTRSHTPLTSRVSLKQDELAIQMSYEINSLMSVNVSTWVKSGQGMQLDGIKIGQLFLPANTGLHIAEFFVDLYTGADIATQAIATIDEVHISERLVKVSLKPLHEAIKEIKNIDLGGGIEKQRQIAKIAEYLTLLSKVSSDKQRSLNYYVNAVVTEAKKRSNNNVELAIEENRAAILSLAVFAGDSRFSSAIGNIRAIHRSIPTAQVKPVLHGRNDLNDHFIYSAAIKLLSEQEFSFAIGEFKELMDRAPGGSGYSFVDLAADMAGVHFATLATDPETAFSFQTTLTAVNAESAFMPHIDGLEEGLSKSEFERKYGSVDSQRYDQKLTEIRARISALAISQ